MKKVIALLMVLLISLALSAPLLVAAETVDATPAETGQAVFVEPTEAPVVSTATETAQETDPGGIDLTPLLQALVGVLALVITRYFVPWLQAHTTAQQLAKIDYWHTVAVTAMEKAYGAGHGPEKLAGATEYLKGKGIIVDAKIVDSLIQKFFKNGKKTDTTTTTTT